MSAAKALLAASDRDPTAGLPASARRGVWWPIRLLAWLMAAILLSGIIIAPLDTWSQTLFATFTFGLCWALSLIPGRWVTLTLIIVSVTTSLRYLHWRMSTTVGNEDGLDMALGLVLFFAESYAVLVLVLGYVQTAWPLERKPVALPADSRTWPTVDIYIPTYNEPLSVVRTTILAAKALDWPADKLFVHLLDDGRREEFRLFCQRAGVNYIVRPDNKHAKAGNINHALKKTRGDLVAIFDCDHIPTRSFLQLTVGWFLRDPKIALVQTPHHFYTPDPFERNLSNFKKIPNEGELFYGPIQKGNDLWNATFFCGSCAVIRRAPLEEVGGIAPETVTEDAHTMLKLHRRGYSSAYIDIPQAAGLATESLSGHVGQRIRWARGMAQIFRVDNPLLGRGLGLVQRLCYASAMLHFFYGIPRLIFLTAPLAFLVFDAHIFNASAETILAFALPHMAHAYLTNSRIQGAHRHSFWAEVYEATLATYIIYPTTLALISPKLGKFNVTAKGGVVDHDYFDHKIAFPYLVLVALNLFGTGMGIYKLTRPDAQTSAIFINLAWSGYGLLFLCATLAVAWERRQRRVFPRVDARLPATLRTADQKVVACETINLSTSGLSLLAPMELAVAKDDLVDVTIVIGKDDVPAEARVVQKHGRVLRLTFESMSIESEESLVRATFSRPAAWLGWADGRRRDRPLVALFTVIWHGLSGLARLPRALISKGGASVLLMGLLGLALLHDPAAAQPRGTPDAGPDGWNGGAPLEVDPVGVGVDDPPEPTPTPTPVEPVVPVVPPPPGEPDKRVEAPFLPTTTWSLEHLGFDKAVRTYNRRTAIRLPFYARGDEVFLAARLRLDLDQSVKVPDGVSAAKISVNDEVIATIKFDGSMPARLDLDVPPQQLGEKNALSVELVLASGAACPVLVDVGTWRFLVGGRLEAMSAPLPLPNQLDMLPVPFFDPFADSVTPITFVFGQALVGTSGSGGVAAGGKPAVGPSERLVKIGGYLAAYFGVRGGARFSFPTSFGALPEGHAVVFYVPGMKTTPEIGDLGPVVGPMVALRDNPAGKKKHSKVLVVAGRDLDELEVAARRLLLDFEATKGQGATVRFDYAPTVEPRQPYDAPRWFPGGAPLPLGVVADKAGRTFRGALGGSVSFEMRIPPDVFTWPSAYVTLDLEWSSVVPPGVEAPELSVEINGHFLARLSLERDPVEAEHQAKRLRLPVTELRGFNRLNVHVIPPKNACPNPDADVVVVEVLDTSVLHLEGHERYRPMPDLETFVNDGFPFTRMADLGETLLVLPREPEPGEVASALSFIAHTSAITGHPPTGLTVALTNAPESLEPGDRDLLVIGAAGRLAGWAPWEGRMPIRGLTDREPGHVQLPSVSWFQRAMAFLQGVPLGDDLERLGRSLRPGESRSYAVGFESTWSPGRSVVLLSADTASAMPNLPAMKGFAEALQARADVLVMSGERRAVFRVLSNYASGGLPPFLTFLWFIASHWVVLMPVLLLTAMAFAWMLKRRLNNVAWRRLNVGSKA
jgi:cellulose synthase (UDP-forming)